MEKINVKYINVNLQDLEELIKGVKKDNDSYFICDYYVNCEDCPFDGQKLRKFNKRIFDCSDVLGIFTCYDESVKTTLRALKNFREQYISYITNSVKRIKR